MIRILWLALWLAFLAPATADAAPVAAFIVAAAGLTGTAATIATFVIEVGLTVAANFALKFLGGGTGASASTAQARQASVTTLQLAEQPRRVLFGRMGTAGTLVDAFNHGGENGTDFETIILRIADHECDALEGVWFNDTYVPYEAAGLQSALNDRASVWFLPGTADQTLPGFVYDAAPNGGGWPATNKLTGVAAVVISYEADAPDTQSPQWPAGRPQLMAVVRGKKCYDPRQDSTVGGSGSQRWTDPSTWTWSENAIVCRYNWVRGIFACDRVDQLDQLLVGRGLTDIEAPPQRVFGPANLCDEEVETPTGTEPRYRVGGVINDSDDHATVEGWFADAVAGSIIQPEGSVEIDPGQAKTPVFDITDADLVAAVPGDTSPTPAVLEFSAFGSQANRINTVIPQYVDPEQRWAQATATVQRDYDDILADGASLEETLPLTLVTSRTQAERIGAIRRRARRLERTAKIVLGPRFAGVEEGDWGVWTSDLHTGGLPVTFVVQAYALGPDWRNALVLTETADSVYGFGDHTVQSPGLEFHLPPDSVALGHVLPEAVILSGDGGEAVPAVRFRWDTPVDPAIQRVRAEIRLPGEPSTVTASLTDNPNAGVWTVTNGVGANYLVEVRLVPVAPGRFIAPSAWTELALGESIATFVKRLADRTVEEAIAQLDATIQAATDLLGQANTLAETIIAQALQGDTDRRYVDVQTHIDGDSLVSITNLIAVMRADKLAVDLQIDKVVIDPATGETFADRMTALLASDASLSASVTTEQTARISADSALATSLSVVSTTVSGHTATIATQQTSINGILAKYSVALDVNGRIIGWTAINNGSSGSIVFVTDQFAIGNPAGTSSIQPFFYDSGTGTLYLQNVYAQLIKADVVDVDHLVNNSVTERSVADTAGGYPGSGGWVTVLSFTINMRRAGDIFASATVQQGFASIPASWAWSLNIDGVAVSNPSGTVPGDSVSLSGQRSVAAGSRTVELLWNASSAINLGNCCLPAQGFYK